MNVLDRPGACCDDAAGAEPCCRRCGRGWVRPSGCANNWVALASAYPLAIAHEPGLSPRENFGSSIGKFFDRLHVARAFRALRRTHHVRQIALTRLGSTGRKLAKLDPILDIVNITSAVGAIIDVGTLGSLSAS